MISAFGPRAQHYMRGLGELDAIVTDLATLPDAYVEAVARRVRGESFYGMLLLDDQRARLTMEIAPTALKMVEGFDERRIAFDQLGNGSAVVNTKPVSNMWELDALQSMVAREFLALSDAMLVRSYAEYARICGMFPRPPRPHERVLVEPELPAFERRPASEPSVVLWAPRRPAEDLALHASALEEFRGLLTCVSQGGPLPHGVSATFVEADDPKVRDVLATAGCIVCIEPGDPGDAVAFARRGYGVVAAGTSGVAEFVHDVVVFDAAWARSLPTAVAIALGRPASIRDVPAPPPRAPQPPAAPVRPEELPLVTIVTATYNRHEDLRMMLGCLAAQTYPKIEALVMNDGGAPVDEIVAGFPFARALDMEVNSGGVVAANRGIREAKGSFVGFLPDDDWLYPDHVERLVYAMLRSGASVGHSNTLVRFEEKNALGTWDTTGFAGSVFAYTTTPTDALVSTPIAGQSLMFRRSVFEEIGYWRSDSILADQELQIRATDRYLFVYVDHVTGEWRSRHGSNISSSMGDTFPIEMRRIFDELHPVQNRPKVDDAREEAIRTVLARPAGKAPWEPTLKLR